MGLPITKLSPQEFLSWEERQPERHEFFRGEVFAMAGGTRAHNRVVVNMTRRIDAHLDGTQCEVFSENMKLQMSDGGFFYPDIMVACGREIADNAVVIQEPVLIVEVLSPSTRDFDRTEKFAAYQSIGSLREYVLLDPVTRKVEVYARTAAGWLPLGDAAPGVVKLTSIGLVMPAEWAFKGLGEAL